MNITGVATSDGADKIGQYRPMSFVELQQIDPSENRYRYYSLSESITLFGHPCLWIVWGRIGSLLRGRDEWFADPEALTRRRRQLLARRRRHGYEIVGDR